MTTSGVIHVCACHPGSGPADRFLGIRGLSKRHSYHTPDRHSHERRPRGAGHRAALIRTPLRELLPQLEADEFWQVHRAVVVRAQAIEAVTRDEIGKLWLQLRGRAERLAVSRLYAHRFKAM